jgi:hypothetical protein
MSHLSTLASVDHPQPHTAEQRRFGSVAAYLAAPLWAVQAPIWLFAPKVQEPAAPFTITEPLLFVLFWSSIAGAVAFSAAGAAGIPRTIHGLGSRLSRWVRLLATIASGLATAATIFIVATAVFPGVQGVAIAVMTNTLNAALLVLATSVVLAAFLSRRIRALRRTGILVTAIAAATIAMIAATLASASHSMIGLYAAVAVAIINGIVWLVWARESGIGRRR